MVGNIHPKVAGIPLPPARCAGSTPARPSWYLASLPSGNIPSLQRIPSRTGCVVVGDGGQVIDPWSGQGMDQASNHAMLLAESLDRYLTGILEWGQASGPSRKRRNASSKKAYERTTTYPRDFRPMTKAAFARRGLS
jgi:flavin-dependent dehydrogenase